MAKNEYTLKLEHHVFEPQRHLGLPDIVMSKGFALERGYFPCVLRAVIGSGYRIHALLSRPR